MDTKYTQSEKIRKISTAFLVRFKACHSQWNFFLKDVCLPGLLYGRASLETRVQTTNSAVKTLLRVRAECTSGQVAHTAGFPSYPSKERLGVFRFSLPGWDVTPSLGYPQD